MAGVSFLFPAVDVDFRFFQTMCDRIRFGNITEKNLQKKNITGNLAITVKNISPIDFK